MRSLLEIVNFNDTSIVEEKYSQGVEVYGDILSCIMPSALNKWKVTRAKTWEDFMDEYEDLNKA
jgi:hypothetical protein